MSLLRKINWGKHTVNSGNQPSKIMNGTDLYCILIVIENFKQITHLQK